MEAMVTCIGEHAQKRGLITPAEASGALADTIDALYAKNAFRNHRAALGAARDFIKEFRNIASHPQRTAKEAMTKLQKCRAGFLTGIGVAAKLRAAMQLLHYNVRIHIA